jgi:hypothetical protein
MGVTSVTTHTYTCDVCGFASEDELFRSAYATVRFTVCGKAYNGDVGGTTFKQWWCGTCYYSYQDWKKERREREQMTTIRESK